MYNEYSGDTLARLRSDGEAALAEFFTQQRAGLRRMVQRRMDARLQRRIDASDILQEGFVDAVRRLEVYLERPTLPLLLWVKLVVKRCIIASYRRHFRAKRRDLRREEVRCPDLQGGVEDDRGEQIVARIDTPSAIVSRAEQRACIRSAVACLDPIDRQIILLRHVQQLANADVANRLGLTPSAASKRYIRALARLRSQA